MISIQKVVLIVSTQLEPLYYSQERKSKTAQIDLFVMDVSGTLIDIDQIRANFIFILGECQSKYIYKS